MKTIKIILRILAFTCSWIAPLLLLGVISPLTHGELGQGLTGLGYVALAGIAAVVAVKLFGKIYKMEKSWKRALIISAFPISIWLLVMLGIDYVKALLISVCDYWLYVGIFILIGRALAVVEECLHENEKVIDAPTESEAINE
jgi:hypothetical protein